ncbi:Replication factor A protein 2 [Pseudocercospora fuligena]|uniref:Replication factor A protein 2 n=1 Tax=Pseudocercospora fuligena TaxID=685502 RepID=A0A8H6VQA3_9PEZI|nr:Replication factor A protein 2 [Pseudocercospora fuligena]
MDTGYGGYSTTSYGAQGGAAGGGFMPGSQGEGSASNKRSYGKDTLRPVTIKQLIDAHHPHPDAEHFMIDDSETTQVTFVAQVRNISTQTTNVTYKLDDGTGTIEVKVWVDAEAASMEDGKQKVVEQGHARVWGRLKQFNNKRHVGAQFIRPIQDLNEISYHLLEATVVHLHYTKGPVEHLQANGGAQQSNGMGYGQQNGMSNGGGGDAGGMAGLSPTARKVYSALRNTTQTNEGLHAQVIAQQVGLEISEVMKAGDELMGLGKVYTTVDDLTWALLDL